MSHDREERSAERGGEEIQCVCVCVAVSVIVMFGI